MLAQLSHSLTKSTSYPFDLSLKDSLLPFPPSILFSITAWVFNWFPCYHPPHRQYKFQQEILCHHRPMHSRILAMIFMHLKFCVCVRRWLGGDDNVVDRRPLGWFCALLFSGCTLWNRSRAMIRNVCEGIPRTKSTLPWKCRVVYVKLTACLLEFLFSCNRRHITTACLLCVILSFHCLHIFTACLLHVFSWNWIYILVTVWLLGVLFQSQWLHLCTYWLLGSLSWKCLHIFTYCLLVIIFST